ncbi:MAG TPA: arginase family protein [Myxococcota bacterium]|nr:arginase family protein [Myxococcota bacterium]
MSQTFDVDGPAVGGGLFGLPVAAGEAAVVVVPVPFEATTSFGRGTAGAPQAILEASWQVDLHDLDVGEPWREGIVMLPVDPRVVAWNDEACRLAAPVIAAGGAGDDPELSEAVAAVNRIGELLNEHVYQEVRRLLAEGRVPCVLGGDHAVPFGAHRAVAERFPGVGLLHIDAHADLRDAYEGFVWSHASVLFNTLTRVPEVGQVVQVGLRDVGAAEHTFAEGEDRVTWFTDAWLADEAADGTSWRTICQRIVEPLPPEVWITFDIDGLDPALCPGTGTPVPGGLGWREVILLLATLARSGRRIVGFDLVEVGAGAWDANVGARLLHKLAGFALESRRTA